MRVSELQKGNELIKWIRRINIEYKYSVFDYEPGSHFGVIHISLHLHFQSPKYLFSRIERVKESATKRVPIVILLINSDVNTPTGSSTLSKLQLDCISVGVQLVPSHSPIESASYIENMHLQEGPMSPSQSYKGEQKINTAQSYKGVLISSLRNYKGTLQEIKKKIPGIESEAKARQILFLSAVPTISRTDAVNLLQSKSIREVAEESKSSTLTSHRGIGEGKKKEMQSFFLEKFK